MTCEGDSWLPSDDNFHVHSQSAKQKAEKQLERHVADMETATRSGRDDKIARAGKQVWPLVDL